MKGPLYRSDDGQKEGTREEVEAYEASLNPLAKFKFPWEVSDRGFMWNAVRNSAYRNISTEELCALLNLMPLVEELRQAIEKQVPQWRTADWQRDLDATQKLLLAYEKALGVKS